LATRRDPRGDAVARLLGCDADRRSGSLEDTGATLAGFEVVGSAPPDLLALAGQHHFARYEVVFRIEPLDPGR
jgi:hypothetical protein